MLKLYEGDRYYFDGPYGLNITGGEGQVLTVEEVENLKKRFMLRENGEIFDNSKFMNELLHKAFPNEILILTIQCHRQLIT